MQWFTEIHVGKAMPFFKSFSFLKTLLVSSSNNLSPNSHISRTEAPGMHTFKTWLRTPENKINN